MIAVGETIGEEIANVQYNKLLIKKPIFPENLKWETSEITEIFLKNEDPDIEEDKLKKRGSHDSFTYQRKSKYKKADDHSKEVRTPITSLQFVTIKENNSDPDFNIIERERINFVFKNLSYCVDVYSNIEGE